MEFNSVAPVSRHIYFARKLVIGVQSWNINFNNMNHFNK